MHRAIVACFVGACITGIHVGLYWFQKFILSPSACGVSMSCAKKIPLVQLLVQIDGLSQLKT